MTHEERVWHHEMVTNEGIHEHAERIASLEELVLDLYGQLHGIIIDNWCYSTDDLDMLAARIAELGVSE